MLSKPWRAALAGILVAAAVTLPGLGIGTLWDNSETAYGEVAREVLLFGDPVVLHLNATPWFVQPPLYFWLAAIFAKIFGVGTFAMRLPAALATIAMGAAAGYAAARVAGTRAGAYVAVVLSTTLMQAIIGRLAIMDALLDGAVAATVFLWFRACDLGDDRAFVWGCVAAALGVLAKGPVALVIALLVILPWFWWERRSGSALHVPSLPVLAGGAAIFIAVAAPWFIALGAREGPGAIATLFGHYTVGRYLGTIENQTGPWFYYLPVVILGFFPWVAFLPAAVRFALRELRGQAGDDHVARLLRLALVWSALPFAFFSVAQTKLPNYIALELPALALLVALWFDRIVEAAPRRSALISAAVVPITIGCIAFAISRFSESMHLTEQTRFVIADLEVLGISMCCGSILTFLALLDRRWAPRAPYVLGVTSIATILIIAFVAEPHAEQLKPIPQLARTIAAQRRPADAVAIQGVSGGNALLFYTSPVVTSLGLAGDVAREGSTTDPRAFICNAPRVFVVASARRAADPSYGRRRTLLARAAGDVLYLFDGPRCDSRV